MIRSERARRFPLRLPILFRSGRDKGWRRAISLTISEARLSFATRWKLRIGEVLEMRFVVRVSSARSEVNCVARVIRQRRDADAMTYVAAIETHQFVKIRR